MFDGMEQAAESGISETPIRRKTQQESSGRGAKGRNRAHRLKRLLGYGEDCISGEGDCAEPERLLQAIPLLDVEEV